MLKNTELSTGIHSKTLIMVEQTHDTLTDTLSKSAHVLRTGLAYSEVSSVIVVVSRIKQAGGSIRKYRGRRYRQSS